MITRLPTYFLFEELSKQNKLLPKVDKGKLPERVGRKAMGLRFSNQDRQVAHVNAQMDGEYLKTVDLKYSLFLYFDSSV